MTWKKGVPIIEAFLSAGVSVRVRDLPRGYETLRNVPRLSTRFCRDHVTPSDTGCFGGDDNKGR